MKRFKLFIVVSMSAVSLYVNAISLLTSSLTASSSGGSLLNSSSAANSSVNSSSLPASIPSSGMLSLKGSSLPSIIVNVPSPLNLLSASSLASF